MPQHPIRSIRDTTAILRGAVHDSNQIGIEHRKEPTFWHAEEASICWTRNIPSIQQEGGWLCAFFTPQAF